jgi:hypothetical protein
MTNVHRAARDRINTSWSLRISEGRFHVNDPPRPKFVVLASSVNLQSAIVNLKSRGR